MTIRQNQTRRGFMRGMGVTMAALPVVPAMVPSRNAEASGLQQPPVGRIPESVIAQQRLPESVIAGWRKLQTDIASICDVLVTLNLENCIYHGGVQPLDPKHTMCGPARTMRLIPMQDPRNQKTEEVHPGSLIDDAQPGDIIVIDQGGMVDKCIWGGNTATSCWLAGVGGVLIDGATRDALQVLETGVPHFVKGTTPRAAHGVWRSTSVMSDPVQIGTTAVAPGDLVIGNLDGIVVIPRARAAEILPLATEKHLRDQEGQKARRAQTPIERPR